MMLRGIAAFVGVVCLALIAWIAVLALGPEHRVLPTNGVIGGQAADDPVQGTGGREALDQRARLMDWRGDTGPSPDAPAPQAGRNEPPLAVLPDGGPRVFEVSPRETYEAWLARVQEDDPLLQDPAFHAGSSTLPGRAMQVFEQPQGRDWRSTRNGLISYGGGFLVFGVTALLAFFLAIRGRVEVKEGFSGRTVQRFNLIERANHWMTAVSFLLLALTGIVILYGTNIIRPWLGPSLFGDLAQGSVWLHMALLVPFTLGISLMFAMWVWQNIITGIDLKWLKKGGGMVNPNVEPPPAPRFNAGQKIIFWLVVIGGFTLIATGIIMMFPFIVFGYDGMQLAQSIHAGAALAMIAVIIGHIYIGTVGMEGAFDAMWSGRVDRNWAHEHHLIWYEKLVRKGKAPPEPAE
ncbi:formate dehydrogenase subunit gamma [Lutibaculum baratangense]|uniref:Formate dehydrogenase-O, gamma subunit n=1 Tax=Lutibaculum baratangense AMV1 TaxID=631454 RepID=V4RGT6_9HYPH|nr:formate dehydrogenase subunit gamma [Lutibaculum baratangense]ESR24579.1 Formate dehydrogenase -O, gamma subunit [Lutibaculum baratangense AMV1]